MKEQLEASTSELGEVKHELARERIRVEKATERQKRDREALKKAREALTGLVSQLQGPDDDEDG